MEKLSSLPTFLDKVSKKINSLKKPNHTHIAVTSGTAFLINKDVCNQKPIEQRMELQRKLLMDWMSGVQTLNGLKAFIKEKSVTYIDDNVDRLLISIQHDFSLNENNITLFIIPEEFVGEIKNKYPLLNVVAKENILFFD